ncbi:hypothetical protein ACH5RR_040855 [Cinchona calisaya]|uniref:Hepatoma-derived growth factor-related protein 2-like n=1 Tax=Cinchona calisaya TaxID=153742 RepID=A0ABD2XXA5_9GENT
MADFSFLSDSDNEKTVDELLSQVMDQSILEQVAAINCSGFTDLSLPTHLETRFQKLKSFPSANSKPKKSSTHCHSAATVSKNDDWKKGFDLDLEKNSVEKGGLKENSNSGFCSIPSKSLSFSSKDEIFSHSKKNLDWKMGLKAKSETQFPSSASNSFDFSVENEIFSCSKKIPDGKKRGELKSPSGSSLFPSDSSTRSLSPPQKSGCLWCSPKKGVRKKNNENRVLNINLDWGKNDEFLSDLNTFSGKTQQKLLKKAMKEEEKMSREAEKIVEWAKETSARMEVSNIEDELSDNDSLK